MSQTRREWMKAAAGILGCAPVRAAGDRPNVVVIVSDDQGWWDLGAHGNRDIRTPVLDRLSAESVSFSNFYACPVCAPTRASLMTGRHYLRTGVYNTRFGGDTMRDSETTLAQAMRARGYRTGLFGKWHLGHYRRYQPQNRGFDDALTFLPGHTERYFYPDALAWNGRPVRARGYISDILTDGAISFARANRTRPFFLYLAYNVPHAPNIIDDRYLEPYLKRGVPLHDAQIYGMLTNCDENIGRLLDTLRQEKLDENTVVLFLSDNGGVSRHFRAGLRGGKGTAFEGGVRVPFMARWPGRLPAGARVGARAAVIDILPTICDLTGTPLPRPAGEIDGKSLAAILQKGSGSGPHEHLFHIWDRYRPSLTSNWGICGARYKLVRDQLFDLDNDPGEAKDLASAHPEVAADLRRRFEQWLAEVTRGQTMQPVPIEVGREDENPVELQASWAQVDGTHVTWASPGRGQTSRADPLGRPASGRDGELHVRGIRVGYHRRLAQSRRSSALESGSGRGGRVRGSGELRLRPAVCGRRVPRGGGEKLVAGDGGADRGPQSLRDARAGHAAAGAGTGHVGGIGAGRQGR